MSTIAEGRESRQIPYVQELLRKLTHLGALVIPASYYLLDLDRFGMLAIILPLTILVFLIDLARLRRWPLWSGFARQFWGPMIRRHEEAGGYTGATFILLAMSVCVFVFSKPVATCAVSFIIVGDALAAIVGRTWGKTRFFGKTIEGSLGCLAGTVIVAFLAPDIPLAVALPGAVAATLTEAAPTNWDDNFTVPVVSGLVMTLAFNILT